MKATSSRRLPLSFPRLLGFAACTMMLVQAHAQDCASMVREMVTTELAAPRGDWRYESVARDRTGPTETRDVIETKEGNVYRVKMIDGHPLTPAEEAHEQKRLRATQPDHERKLHQQKALEMITLFPDAFHFSLNHYDGGMLVCDFHPSPNFTPPFREALIFRAMNGTLTLDSKEKRLVAFAATLGKRVDFGFGLLGHLDGGASFGAQRRALSNTEWKSTRIDVDLNGAEVLFRTISIHQHESHSGFIQVRPMTLQEGIQQLQAEALHARLK
jgi:hypothetical protein